MDDVIANTHSNGTEMSTQREDKALKLVKDQELALNRLGSAMMNQKNNDCKDDPFLKGCEQLKDVMKDGKKK